MTAADTDLTLTRILRAPRAQVWKAWTDPEALKQWLTPKPALTTEAVVDLRPGGRFYTLMMVDGKPYPNEWTYLEVVPEERLVFTDVLTEGWKPSRAGLGFAAIITLKDHPMGCEYTAIARHPDADTSRRHAEMGFHDGWNSAATQLEAVAASLPGTRDLVITRWLAAPVASVWRAWTDPQVLPRWFGPKGLTCRTKEIRLEDGGVWRFDMVGADVTYPNRHRDLAYQPMERISYLMDDDTESYPAIAVSVELRHEGDGTRLILRMVMPSDEAKAGAVAMGAIPAGETTLDKLAALLAEG